MGGLYRRPHTAECTRNYSGYAQGVGSAYISPAFWCRVCLHIIQQSSVKERSFFRWGAPRHRHYKLGNEGTVLATILRADARTQLHYSLDINDQGSQLLQDHALRHGFADFFTSSGTLQSSGSEKVWKDTPLLASSNVGVATVARKPAVVSDTITKTLSLDLGHETASPCSPQPDQEATRVAESCNKYSCLIASLSC